MRQLHSRAILLANKYMNVCNDQRFAKADVNDDQSNSSAYELPIPFYALFPLIRHSREYMLVQHNCSMLGMQGA